MEWPRKSLLIRRHLKLSSEESAGPILGAGPSGQAEEPRHRPGGQSGHDVEQGGQGLLAAGLEGARVRGSQSVADLVRRGKEFCFHSEMRGL